MTVEHVFFRQKGMVHTTRSQWIVGLVLDLKMYEQYLIHTNNTIRQAMDQLRKGRVHFEKMFRDSSYRTVTKQRAPENPYTRVSWTDEEFKSYAEIMHQHKKGLEVLEEIHEKNWKDFIELRATGHSELESNRMGSSLIRKKKALGLILGGIAGIFSGFSLFTTHKLKTEVAALRNSQQITRSILKESLSLINLTRMEIQENRWAINDVIKTMGNIVKVWEGKLIQLKRFVITTEEITSNTDQVRDLVSTETTLIMELKQKIAKLATGRLSPAILPAPELVTILKGIEVEIPKALMLPQDPRDKPFYYYTILTTDTIALENELVIMIEIPLLDVARKFRIMEAIALPVPYTATSLTAVYELEFKNFAISTDGRQYVVLTWEDQLNCGKKNARFCYLTSAIQEANRHSYCTLALYQKDSDKINGLCQIKVSNTMKLPIAHYIANGEWIVATETIFNLRKLCVGAAEEVLVQVSPPYTAVTLGSGCRALADLIELPIYFQQREEYRVIRESRILKPPENVQISQLTIWRKVSDKGINVIKNLRKLGDLPAIPIEGLIQKIEILEEEEKYTFPDNIMLYSLLAILLVVVVGVIYLIHRRRQAIFRTVMEGMEPYLEAKGGGGWNRGEYTIEKSNQIKEESVPLEGMPSKEIQEEASENNKRNLQLSHLKRKAPKPPIRKVEPD